MDIIDLSPGDETTLDEKEKIDRYEKRIRQIKAQINILKNKKSVRKRKERTRRLIQIGALTEKYLGCEDVNKVENILQELVQKNEFKEVLKRYRNATTINNKK